jgi:hypothetical protein
MVKIKKKIDPNILFISTEHLLSIVSGSAPDQTDPSVASFNRVLTLEHMHHPA